MQCLWWDTLGQKLYSTLPCMIYHVRGLPLCCCNDNLVECRLKPYPTLYETFMIQDGPRWRPPAVNESCCARPQLAATLLRIADDGPDAVYTGQAGQVLHGFI